MALRPTVSYQGNYSNHERYKARASGQETSAFERIHFAHHFVV
jgi:hypothetical protein